MVLSLTFIVIEPAFPQENNPSLTVSTRSFPPFVFEEDGEYTGFSIDLWSAIATELDIEYTLYSENNVTELINSVVTQKADISVAGISMTSEREKIIDFSHPFFESGLQILVSEKKKSPLIIIIESIFTPGIWITIGIVCLLTIIAAHGMWILERKENNEMFPKKYLPGIWESFWWSVVTLVTVGYGDKTPRTVGGRIIATIWMFAGILLISYFTGSVSSALTIERLDSHIRNYHDLRGKSVGTIRGSTSVDFLQSISSVNIIKFDNIESAYSALGQENIDAIVYDFPVLLYYTRQNENNFNVVGQLFDAQSYGIVLPMGSPYRNSINQALLTLRENGTYDEIYEKWFGNNNL